MRTAASYCVLNLDVMHIQMTVFEISIQHLYAKNDNFVLQCTGSRDVCNQQEFRANRNQGQDEHSDIIISYVKYLTLHISLYWHTLV